MSNAENIESGSKRHPNEIRIDRFVMVATYAATFGVVAYVINHFMLGG